MANRARDLVGYLNVSGSKIHIVSDQRRARPHSGYGCGRMNPPLAIVRPSSVGGSDLIADAFKLTFANGGQILAFGSGRRFLVEVNRNTKLAPHSLSASACQRDALVHRNARNG